MKTTKLTLLLLAAMLVGVCIGFYANSAIIRARINRFSQLPANMPEHLTNRLTQRLDLNADQQREIRKIFQAHGVRMREAREQNRALIDALIEEARQDIAQHLTPEQQEEHKKMLIELRERIRNDQATRRALSASPVNHSPAGHPK
ncbi:MAG: hypothetical protein GX803_00360 [Lentisphaerae bacterium]|jgi:Spy/CpxP family protein refolding chaperone|nr:hypothetical protein [Lentisphaerota bacterium]